MGRMVGGKLYGRAANSVGTDTNTGAREKMMKSAGIEVQRTPAELAEEKKRIKGPRPTVLGGASRLGD